MSQINDTRMLEMMRGTPPPTWEQTCLDLDKKLADSRQHVTQLENRLRALWDKLEGERKYYMEQICRLEEESEFRWKLAQSAIGSCEEMSSRIKRLEGVGDEVVINYVNSLSAFEMWRKAKEAKP